MFLFIFKGSRGPPGQNGNLGLKGPRVTIICTVATLNYYSVAYCREMMYCICLSVFPGSDRTPWPVWSTWHAGENKPNELKASSSGLIVTCRYCDTVFVYSLCGLL